MATFDDEQIQAMIAGRRRTRRVPFPVVEGVDIGLRLLTEDELDDARTEAVEYAKRKKFDPLLDPESITRAIQREILSRACVDPDDPSDDPRPFFSSSESVRKLDAPMVAYLFSNYAELGEIVSPWRSLDEGARGALLEALGKEPSAPEMLSTLDRSSLASLCRSMASALLETRRTSK